MSDVEKMYENAGVKKQYCGWLNIGDLDTNVQYIRCETREKYDNYAALDSSDLIQTTPDEVYPPFTAEKQIELIKFITSLGVCEIENWNNKGFHFAIKRERICPTMFLSLSNINLQETLADVINNLWQDLTPEEKQQVKGILE